LGVGSVNKNTEIQRHRVFFSYNLNTLCLCTSVLIVRMMFVARVEVTDPTPSPCRGGERVRGKTMQK